MKKLLTALALVCASTSVLADSLSPANPVLRPITLVDGEVAITGALAYGEESNGDNSWQLGFNAGYGITDDLTLDFSGLRYRFLAREGNKEGLELTAGAGLHGMYETQMEGDDETFGYGFDISGKYVFSDDFAVNFGAGYTLWNGDVVSNRKETFYSVGVQKNIVENLTLMANYTYRDLRDFEQDHAYSATIGVNYNLNRNTDIGVFISKTDFDTLKNGYESDSQLDKEIGMFLQYRF
ncbi:outer membrane beta-barrel protein [Paraneptunicella aestuarii]|uniref:porin n=1 Tax=Paraneptunicella aestuarii TaxID=2831148 RepID=UPI001E2B22A6|nr:porin [Paraneptunicella aestuarii]UAA38418.1 outer membrane beta-barrel protein [Paraneptunicella aestuarii]